MKKFNSREEYQAWKDGLNRNEINSDKTNVKKGGTKIFLVLLVIITIIVGVIISIQISIKNDLIAEQNELARKREAHEAEVRLKKETEEKVIADKREQGIAEQIRKDVEIENANTQKTKKLNYITDVKNVMEIATLQCFELCYDFHTKMLVEEVTTGYYSSGRQRLVYLKDGTVENMDETKKVVDKTFQTIVSIKEDGYSEIYAELFHVYDAYGKCLDLSSGPTGSLLGYKSSIDENFEKYKTSSSRLEILLPPR